MISQFSRFSLFYKRRGYDRPSAYNQEMEEKEKSKNIIHDIAYFAFIALMIFLFQFFVARPYKIPSASMEPTIMTGERIIAEKLTYSFRDPKVGEIVVFKPPVGADTETCASNQGPVNESKAACSRSDSTKSKDTYIKRVVAVGGDRVSVKNGQYIVNGKPQDKGTRCQAVEEGCQLPETIVVPKGYVYVSGDNRANSADSRYWGPVPNDWIIGKAIVKYWPLNKIGTV